MTQSVIIFFSVTESVILMKLGELSYCGNFFDFGNVFDDIHPIGLGNINALNGSTLKGMPFFGS